MSLDEKMGQFRTRLNSSVYKRVWEHSPTLADMLVSDVKMPRITGRGILNTAMVGITYFIMSCCDNDDHRKPVTSYQCSNGIDDDGDGHTDMADQYCSSATDNDESPFDDLVAPGAVSDLAVVNPAGTYVEEIALRWISTGDDDMTGTPSFFLIRYAPNNPILTENDWNNAIDLASVTASGSAGTGYTQTFPVPPGIQCFAMKVYDEANNESGLSNSVCMDVISRAQYFVDFWLPVELTQLTYDEAVAMINGEGAINPNVVGLATEMINCSNCGVFSNQQELQNLMMLYADGVYDPAEINNPLDPFGAGNFELTPLAAYNWDPEQLSGNPLRVYMILQTPSGNAPQPYNDLTQQNMDNLRQIIKGFLIDFMESHPDRYGNLDVSVCNPGWANPLDKTCNN